MIRPHALDPELKVQDFNSVRSFSGSPDQSKKHSFWGARHVLCQSGLEIGTMPCVPIYPIQLDSPADETRD